MSAHPRAEAQPGETPAVPRTGMRDHGRGDDSLQMLRLLCVPLVIRTACTSGCSPALPTARPGARVTGAESAARTGFLVEGLHKEETQEFCADL